MILKHRLDKSRMPKHVAFTVGGHRDWARIHREEMSHVLKHAFKKVNDVMDWQIKYNIPLVTLYLLHGRVAESENFSEIMDSLVEFFDLLVHHQPVFENKIKISILGKWYNLPGRVIDPIKKIIDETKDYDHFFLNLCINYDGREEIVDSCKMIARKILSEKLDVESINQETIKDNLYSSYFLPPDLIIKTGFDKRIHGFLLWDSTEAVIDFPNLLWHDFEEKDFINSIKEYQENK